jgi:hypothetical protein
MRIAIALLAALCAAVGLSASAAAAPAVTAHGQLLHVRANTNESSNWFGYDQGTLEKSGTLFNSIGGDWTVPAARSTPPGRTSTRPTGSGSEAGASTPVAPSATRR